MDQGGDDLLRGERPGYAVCLARRAAHLVDAKFAQDRRGGLRRRLTAVLLSDGGFGRVGDDLAAGYPAAANLRHQALGDESTVAHHAHV